MLETTARFVLCQRCTNCSQHSYTVYRRLDQVQSEDQGGFRRSYQTLDHLATCRLLGQKREQCGFKTWVTTVDFKNAFDSNCHQSLWTSLEKCGIEPHYSSLLKFFADQKGTVLTDKECDMFEIKRSTKQGDLLSS